MGQKCQQQNAAKLVMTASTTSMGAVLPASSAATAMLTLKIKRKATIFQR